MQQGLGRDPHGGEIFCFGGRKGDLVTLLWHDGVGMSLYVKRLEAGQFIWPASRDGTAVSISAARAGPQLIAMVAFDKYGQHQPVNRQSERIAREGIDLSLSTLADLIGHASVALAPIHELIKRHVLTAARTPDNTVSCLPE